MGSITKDIKVTASADDVWAAVRDYGALHQRVVPNFVVDCVVEGDDRIITFAVGAVARERLVSLDDERRRLVYSVVESQVGFTHHQGSVELVDEQTDDGCRIVWTSDFLPAESGPIVEALMSEAAAVMERTFDVSGTTA